MTKGRDQGTGIREQEKPALEVLQLIEVGQLAIARGETRKTVDQAALEELAESIRQNGVNEPLIVRLWAEPQAGRKPEQLKYEIVAGQRRWLASKIAGKTHCPCIVRQMTDAEADEQRVVSNLQRENLPPLEEALAIKALLDAPGATLETVGAKLGKLASYISRRLKLLEAVEPVREALRSGAIELGHALELARLDEKQQIRNLSWLRCGFVFRDQEEDSSDDDDLADDSYEEGDDDSFADDAAGWSRVQETGSHWTPTPESVASLRHRINTTMLRVLSEAPFPLDDELPPMACTECPKRTGNAALLFEDCAQDTCTDQECFDAKTKVWVKFQLDEADKA
ncbi:MAG: ParB/RepB/Spo0J family partition protein, partial [Terracidiphilus sp.]